MKFSVIIPVHNAGKTIQRCIDSLAANRFQDYEIIAVEDGSSDDSWQVLCRLAEEYPQLRIYKNERNRGVSYTRNQGLERAAGEYICFTDSDDWVEPDYLQAFSDALAFSADSLPVCGFVNHDEKYSGRCDEYRWTGFEGMKSVALKKELENLYSHTLLQQLWNKAFSGKVIKTAGIRFDESISIGEDFRFILNYLETTGCSELVLINNPLYHYMRDQAGSLMYQVGIDPVEERLLNMEKFYKLLGFSKQEIDIQIRQKRQAVLESQAYLIFHNIGMSIREKKKRILSLDDAQGRDLYKKNLVIYVKERIALLLKGK